MGELMCCLCGRSYDNAYDYAACVEKCTNKIRLIDEQKRIEEEKKRIEENNAKKKARLQEIETAEENLIQLKKAFIKDYGINNDIEIPWPVSWHLF